MLAPHRTRRRSRSGRRLAVAALGGLVVPAQAAGTPSPPPRDKALQRQLDQWTSWSAPCSGTERPPGAQPSARQARLGQAGGDGVHLVLRQPRLAHDGHHATVVQRGPPHPDAQRHGQLPPRLRLTFLLGHACSQPSTSVHGKHSRERGT
ncbi:hypothetical protein EOT10_28365 [Streptomyces antnestii]|uniref:Secreted protein n=1 Tax=Streptomyces antnestii TaxID=2494256 RepID=A0A3S2VXJ1_9ACTN|nr:hypothetical protein EOT10_28365 [Streptomyces sp. San01]